MKGETKSHPSNARRRCNEPFRSMNFSAQPKYDLHNEATHHVSPSPSTHTVPVSSRYGSGFGKADIHSRFLFPAFFFPLSRGRGAGGEGLLRVNPYGSG